MQATRNLILASMFAAVMTILAQISIPQPFSPVPLTGQTFGVFLTGALLGRKWGTISMLVYLLLGAVGAPVFHGGQGGLQILVGFSGGYLFGFVIGVYLMGWVLSNKKITYLRLSLGMLLCLASFYSLGTLQLAVVAGFTLKQAIIGGILPFLPLDIAKLVGAATITLPVHRILTRAGLLP